VEKAKERLTATHSVLADVRVIKLLGLNKTLPQSVKNLRETEVDASAFPKCSSSRAGVK
jgi:hypothetical protein